MRAVRFEGNGVGVTVRRDAPMPEPAVGEALIRPTRVAISPLDLAVARGHMGTQPITLGHEFVGVVEKVNAAPSASGSSRRPADEARRLVGKRVVGSIDAVCGQCDLCKRGLSNHCRGRTVLGVRDHDGCFADAFCLPIANLVPVPDNVDDDHAVFAEPLASALHAAQQVRIEGRTYITVLGDGPVAMLCAQVMTKLNASVRLLGASEDKLALCERWGVKHRPMSEAGRRHDQDVVIVCTGDAAGLKLALEMVRPRGVIVLKTAVSSHGNVGMSTSEPLDLSSIVVDEIEIVGSRGGSIVDAVTTLSKGGVDVVSLITRRSHLDDAVEAMRAAERPEQIKVVLEI